MLYALGGKQPVLTEPHFIAREAVVIGDVHVGPNVSIWFNAVIRGDNDKITIAQGTNIQDGAVLHVDEGVPLSLGEFVTVGHKAMLHGCTVGKGSLIGMNAVVLNHAVIGKNCLVGANALVTEGTVIPDGSLVLGSPAKVIKPLSEDAIKQMQLGTQSYIDKIAMFNQELIVV